MEIISENIFDIRQLYEKKLEPDHSRGSNLTWKREFSDLKKQLTSALQKFGKKKFLFYSEFWLNQEFRIKMNKYCHFSTTFHFPDFSAFLAVLIGFAIDAGWSSIS